MFGFSKLALHLIGKVPVCFPKQKPNKKNVKNIVLTLLLSDVPGAAPHISVEKQLDRKEYVGDKIGEKFAFLINPSAVSNIHRGQVHYM